MRILAKPHWVFLHLLHYLRLLVFPAAFSDFLGKVVAKGVIHEFHEVVNGVLKYDVN